SGLNHYHCAVMFSLIPHGRRSIELPLRLNLVNLLQNASAFSSDVSSLQDGRKGKTFTVSYLVHSLGLTRKLSETISTKVNLEDKCNPDSVLSLLRSHGFTDSHLSSIVTNYPRLLTADAEGSLSPKLKFLKSRGASSSELSETLSKVPRILGVKKEKSISIYYDFVRDVIEADKSLEYVKLRPSSLPQGSQQENKLRNVSALRDLDVWAMFKKYPPFLNNSEKKVTQTIETLKMCGLQEDEILSLFEKFPQCISYSEEKMEKAIDTLLCLGFSKGDLTVILKRFPQFIGLSAESLKEKTEFLVKEMNWPLKAVVSTPAVLGYSLEKRTVPRCNVIKALMTKGLLGSELPTISPVLAIADEAFLNKYVRKHNDKKLVAELMATFTGKKKKNKKNLDLKWPSFIVSLNLSRNASSSSASGLKGKNFTVSYLVDSLSFTPKLAESISKKVTFDDKSRPDSVLNLFKSHGFTDSQISTIITAYPLLLTADAEKSLTVYYDFVKEVIEADKKSTSTLCLPKRGKQENKIRNISALRELGMPQRMLFPLLISNRPHICGKERFQESLKKVVEMGFDPTTPRFLEALRIVMGMNNETVQEKVSVYKRLGFTAEDILVMFKRFPIFLALSEKKITQENILNSVETFLGLGFSRDEIAMMVKRLPASIGYAGETVKRKTEFVVKEMSWPLRAVALFPQVLGLSMEKRIVPRCNVIKALISKGLIKSELLPSLSSALVCTDQDFLKRYVRKHDEDEEFVAELMAVFTGEMRTNK
ncbi:hypothetical protein HID58_032685, partial [Brassica napus]